MKIAVIQFNADDKKKNNIIRAYGFVEDAIKRGARFILLPEVFNYRGPINAGILKESLAEQIPGESTLPFLQLARHKKVFILIGSIYESIKNSRQVYNTSILIDDKGVAANTYRKINLFDAVIGKKKIRESKYFQAGNSLSMASVKNFEVGMTICYDIRFPEIYRRYAGQGCHMLTVPSSFTKKTGEVHWEILLRARAIENLCYVAAPNQTGNDGRGVPSYGNSIIVDPWGRVLARASEDKEEIIYADINLLEIIKARKTLPMIHCKGNKIRNFS